MKGKEGEERGREGGEGKERMKKRRKDGKDLLPANKVNKITPTPQTSTGSARYGASLFNYSTTLSASTANEETGTKRGDEETKRKENSKTESAHLRRNIRQTPTPLCQRPRLSRFLEFIHRR